MMTRRELVKGLGVAVTSAALRPILADGLFAEVAPKPLFLEVPSSTSGITWRHVNGRSPDYYLPETTGAGCAFLDFDNDDWMDIYLVNSGKCDFYTPSEPLRNAL
jgi:enediyne biosynthesis protein E4